MKKVIAILALVALTGNIARAELLKNFKYDGKIEVNAFTINNQDNDAGIKDKVSDVDARVILNAGFDLNDDVNAVITAVRCQDQYGTNVKGERPITVALDSFLIEQSYLNLKGVLGFDHKIGRQYYGNEGDLVIYYGTHGFPYTYSALANVNGLRLNNGIEGYTGWYKTGKLDLNVIMAKMPGANGGNAPDTDTDLLGVNAKYELMDVIKVGAYFYEKKTYSTVANVGDLTLDVAGVKAFGKFMGFDYYAEFAKNFGQLGAGNLTGNAILANVKYDMEVMGKWYFIGEFIRTSDVGTTAGEVGNFQSINGDYRPGIIAGGIGIRGFVPADGLTSWNAGAKWNPSMAEKLTVGARFYNFATTAKPITALKYTGYGNELDLSADWKHSENLGLKAYYAMYMVNSDQATALGWKKDATSMLGLALNVKF